MGNLKCQHEWEYFDEHDFPNGYEYDQWNIPHKRCKKCGREYELFDGYGEYAKRWRKVEYWSPELHKLEQELIRTRKALNFAKGALKEQQRWFGVIRVSLISHLNNEYGTVFKSYDADPTVVNIKRANDILNTAIKEITALEKKDEK